MQTFKACFRAEEQTLRNAAPLGLFSHLPSLPPATLHHATPITPHRLPPWCLLLPTTPCHTPSHTVSHRRHGLPGQLPVRCQDPAQTLSPGCGPNDHTCNWTCFQMTWHTPLSRKCHMVFSNPILGTQSPHSPAWLRALTVSVVATARQSCISMMQTTWEETRSAAGRLSSEADA